MPRSPRKFDFNEQIRQPGGRTNFTYESPEPPEELQSRLRREEADARFERIKDLIGYLTALLGLAVVVGFSLWIAAGSRSSPDDKKWATAILTSIVTLWGGYVAGKSQARS